MGGKTGLEVRKPDPIDVSVGNRVRIARAILNMSQERLGETQGLSFQQIQKYEKGVNRISAGALWKIAKALKQPIGFFYQDQPEFPEAEKPKVDMKLFASLNTPESAKLQRLFAKITDPKARQTLVRMASVLAHQADEAGGDVEEAA